MPKEIYKKQETMKKIPKELIKKKKNKNSYTNNTQKNHFTPTTYNIKLFSLFIHFQKKTN